MAANGPFFEPTDRTHIRQVPQRARYDQATIYAILDEALICHVGFVDAGQPYVIPMNYARMDDRLVLHLSHNSRLYKLAAGGVDLCVTVTLLDGLVCGKSATHHSANYRSVVIFGRGRAVLDGDEKMRALRALVDHAFPGRWDEVRATSDKEANATAVLEIPIAEASAKVRSGPPTEDTRDTDLPIWSGEIPLRMAMLPPITAAKVNGEQKSAVPVSESVARYTRPGFVRVNQA